MTRAVKNVAPALLPRLKIPTVEQFARETQEQALLREALEALDAGTPPGVIVRAMTSASMTEEEATTIVRTAYGQLPVARHNAEMYLESRGEPQWCAAKTQRTFGAVMGVLGALGGGVFGFGPQAGLVIPPALLLLGDHTWTLGAVAVLLGIILSARGVQRMKLVRRAALTRRP
ncbi:MAG: hypothetical protein KDA20_01935 [Phycisphaerales bacterium]|nr:hypothetical protein [Phycisphaerales bacterium]